MFRPSAAAGELVALPAVLALLGSELAGVGCKRTERLAVVRAEGVGCVGRASEWALLGESEGGREGGVREGVAPDDGCPGY